MRVGEAIEHVDACTPELGAALGHAVSSFAARDRLFLDQVAQATMYVARIKLLTLLR